MPDIFFFRTSAPMLRVLQMLLYKKSSLPFSGLFKNTWSLCSTLNLETIIRNFIICIQHELKEYKIK